MSALIWVKYENRYQQVTTNLEGRLNVRQIAREFGLDADIVEFNGVLEAYDTNGFSSRVVPGGQAEESAIVVTGQPAAGKSYARQALVLGSVSTWLPQHSTVEVLRLPHRCQCMAAQKAKALHLASVSIWLVQHSTVYIQLHPHTVATLCPKLLLKNMLECRPTSAACLCVRMGRTVLCQVVHFVGV